jgi:hypothetical protein
MHSRRKRMFSGAAACAVASGALSLLLPAPPASASHLSAGSTEIVNPVGGAPLNSGNSNTDFRFKLPTGASCTGDSPNSGYRIQSYLVPQSVALDTLKFDSSGPVPVAGEFRAPMYATDSTAFVDRQTAAAPVPGGPGPIIQPLEAFNFAVYDTVSFPLQPGVYNVGIACTLGPPTSPTQLDKYWNTVMTLTANAAEPGPAKVTWAFGAAPLAPNLVSVTPGDGSLTANYTSTASTPATTQYTATAAPVGGGASVIGTSTSPTSTTIAGLTNGTAYSVTVTASNGAGTSPASSSVTATPAQAPHPAVQNLTATPVTGGVNLNWDAPADAATTPPTSYTVTTTPAEGTTTVDNANTSSATTGLTPGTVYVFEVTAIYATAPGGTPATVSATPLAAQVLVQPLTVTRPVGALVFTQVCGRNGAIPADTSGTVGFPSGSLPAVAAAGPGTAPDYAGGPDPKFAEYPYPENADGSAAPNYPTSCGVALGHAKLVKTGPGRGQFFAASGILSQVTVADTRDGDVGWNAGGTMGAFAAGPGKSFSGSQLGWSPVATSTSEAFTDSDGVTYDQVTSPGPVVAPNTPNATGLSSGRALGTAPGLAGSAPNLTGGLGIAEFDARLKLLIPVTAKSGTYTGVLTISAI